jgi:sec-independent protein translocase protein TatA
MGNIGSSELLIILVLALLLLGPKRLPEVGESLGKTIKRFRQASRELRDELDTDKIVGLHDDDSAKPAPVRPPVAVPAPQIQDTQPREKPAEKGPESE